MNANLKTYWTKKYAPMGESMTPKVDWFERRYQQCVDRHIKISSAKQGALEVYEALWESIVEVVHTAEDKGLHLATNGAPKNRKIILTLDSGPKIELLLSLDEDNLRIVANFDERQIALKISATNSGVASLFADGRPISPQEGARLVMEPFLFEGKGPFAVLAASETD